MRTIQRQISLEPLTSRLPSIWPAYLNNDHKIYFFDEESLSGRSYLHTSNWGMVPLNVAVTPRPSNEGIDASGYSAVTDCEVEEDDKEDNKLILSFYNLSKWYHFFVEYYNLLKNYGHCSRVYTSAEDYYNYESLTKYADQMIYGSDRQTYLNLDAEFAEKGGKVEVKVYDKILNGYSATTPTIAHDEFSGDTLAMIDVYDVGFFKWICENVVPSFSIPSEYREYWKRDVLYYPDVIKWLAWFQERVGKYQGGGGQGAAEFIPRESSKDGVDHWNCKATGVTDCCDCEEFFNRGHGRIYAEMQKWYKAVQSAITENIINAIYDENDNVRECFIPTIINPIELQVSIDDLGEFDIFSEEYELGKDYRVARYGDSANTYSGTVVTINNDSMILSGGSGYTFDAEYMEMNISDDWESYTDKYISENKGDFVVSNITYYTYDENNVKYTSSRETEDEARGDLQEKLTKKYPLRNGDWMLIDGVLYPIEKREYGKYDKTNKYLSGNTFLVYREEGTNTPYTYVNGVKIYAEYYPPMNVFYFPFFISDTATSIDNRNFNIRDYKTFNRYDISDEDKVDSFEYNGSVYVISAHTEVEIDSNTYYRVSAYTETEDYDKLYCISGNVEWYSDFGLENYEVDGYTISANTEDNTIDSVPSADTFTVFSVDEITGRTVSKLQGLRLYNLLTDDIGNTIEGIYVSDSGATNYQPPQGTELEPIYQVGNTANITRFKLTTDNPNAEENFYVGDIITNMTFYYVDYDGNVVDDTMYKVKLGKNGKKIIYHNNSQSPIYTGYDEYTSLLAITYSSDKKDELENSGETKYMQDDIYCDIVYYIGATLSRENGTNTYVLAENMNHGVEYNETVRFIRTNWEYYLKKEKDRRSIWPKKRNNPCIHSISYPICVFLLDQNLEMVEQSQYDTEYSVPMADFKVDINVFSGDSDTFHEKYSGDMATHNNMQVYPIYREEYKLGISSLENVDADIYIDRGINAAYEKHLKLGEVTSLEALEQYGNNFFKIMES